MFSFTGGSGEQGCGCSVCGGVVNIDLHRCWLFSQMDMVSAGKFDRALFVRCNLLIVHICI